MDMEPVVEIVEQLPTPTWKSRAIKAAVIATGVIAGIGIVTWIGGNADVEDDAPTTTD